MAREKGTGATLNEVMGKAGDLRHDLTLKDLPQLLGEKMPELPLDRVGRFRLRKALQIRFGDGYRNIPGVKNILQDFDKEMNFQALLRMNRKRRSK